MSLLKCPECNNNVSEYAEKCPTCGCPMTVIKNFYNKNNGHIFSIINGEEKDVTYFVEKTLDKTWINDIIGFKRKMYDELNLHDMLDFIVAIEKCNGAPKEYNGEKASEYKKRREQIQASLPKCPTCHSTNIEKISAGKKVKGSLLFGVFSSDVRNTMHCKNCGAKW